MKMFCFERYVFILNQMAFPFHALIFCNLRKTGVTNRLPFNMFFCNLHKLLGVKTWTG